MTRNHLQSRGDLLEEAELFDAPGGESLRLRFQGRFEGRVVTWLATLHAIGNPCNTAYPGTSTTPSYIEVGADGPNGIPITAGLQVARIDLPTVRKAMIMIRGYKRLRRGRYEYGGGSGI